MPAGNPEAYNDPRVLAQLLGYQRLQQMLPGFVPDIPEAVVDPVRIPASEAGMGQLVMLLEAIRGRRPAAGSGPVEFHPSSEARQPETVAPGGLEKYSPFGALGGMLNEEEKRRIEEQERLRRGMGR